MGDPGNPPYPGSEPGPEPSSEPDPDQAGWAAPNPPPPPPAPTPAPAPTPVPAAPVQQQWGAPPPTWGAPPPAGPVPPVAGGAWQPPGPPAKRRRLTWLWILIPVLLVLLASTVVVGVFVGRLVLGPIDATNDYLADLSDGRYSAAYASLCSPARRVQSEREFVAQQRDDEQTRGRITSYNIDSFEFNDNDQVTFNDDGDFEGANLDAITKGTVVRGGSRYSIRASIRREDGDWKVCSTVER